MDVDKRNEELDETIIQTCKWIQKKLQISDKSIRDEKSVASVSKKGRVKAKKKGTAVITAKVAKTKLKCRVKRAVTRV